MSPARAGVKTAFTKNPQPIMAPQRKLSWRV
jgi:hypothetical protein